MVPAKFPILIIVPAIALDLLWQRTRYWKPWKIALVSGFRLHRSTDDRRVALRQLPSMTKASENRFFGTMYFDYGTRPEVRRLRISLNPDQGFVLFTGLLRAAIYGPSAHGSA